MRKRINHEPNRSRQHAHTGANGNPLPGDRRTSRPQQANREECEHSTDRREHFQRSGGTKYVQQHPAGENRSEHAATNIGHEEKSNPSAKSIEIRLNDALKHRES